MNNYIDQHKFGVINGIRVQCLPIWEVQHEVMKPSICEFFACAFVGNFPCCIPCTTWEREDKTSVYFKKVGY